MAAQLGVDARSFAATAGEDYELCVCVPAAAAKLIQSSPPANAGVTWIGSVLDGPAGVALSDAGEELSGFEHSF